MTQNGTLDDIMAVDHARKAHMTGKGDYIPLFLICVKATGHPHMDGNCEVLGRSYASTMSCMPVGCLHG